MGNEQSIGPDGRPRPSTPANRGGPPGTPNAQQQNQPSKAPSQPTQPQPPKSPPIRMESQSKPVCLTDSMSTPPSPTLSLRGPPPQSPPPSSSSSSLAPSSPTTPSSTHPTGATAPSTPTPQQAPASSQPEPPPRGGGGGGPGTGSGGAPPASKADQLLNTEEIGKLFASITSSQSIDEQTKTFLRAFVAELGKPHFARLEDVLSLVEDFKNFASPAPTQPNPQKPTVYDLDSAAAHNFFIRHRHLSPPPEIQPPQPSAQPPAPQQEQQGQPSQEVQQQDEKLQQHNIDFRALFNLMDLDGNGRISVLEYLLYRAQRPMQSLFQYKVDTNLLLTLEKNIDACRKKMAEERKEREQRVELLGKTVEQATAQPQPLHNPALVITPAKQPPVATASTKRAPEPKEEQPGTTSQPATGKYANLRSAAAKQAMERRDRAKEARAATAGIQGAMEQTLQAANERGERINNMELKTAELSANAQNFMESVKKLRAQQEKSWW